MKIYPRKVLLKKVYDLYTVIDSYLIGTRCTSKTRDLYTDDSDVSIKNFNIN